MAADAGAHLGASPSAGNKEGGQARRHVVDLIGVEIVQVYSLRYVIEAGICRRGGKHPDSHISNECNTDTDQKPRGIWAFHEGEGP